MEHKQSLKKIGIGPSLALFGSIAVVFYLETHYLIPWFSEFTGWETILSWLLVAGLGTFMPLVLIALILLKIENFSVNKQTWINRLRFQKPDASDWFWSFISIIVIGILTGLIMMIMELLFGETDIHPSFMAFEPLGEGRYWILFVWFPFWVFNIMGEEILWRGVLLPRQELAFGRRTWLYHGFFWTIFHVAFGWQLIITLLPILLILPFVVQKRKNSWTGVIIHAGINGPGFIAVAFNLV